MLQTLLRIGIWQSQGKDKWHQFLDEPKLPTNSGNANTIKCYTLHIIFDLDSQKIWIDKENLEEFDSNKIIQTIPLKIKGGNNKAFYTSVPANKLGQIYKTFFGKEGDDQARNGELMDAFLKLNSSLLTESFKNLLDQIFLLKQSFLEATQITKSNGKKEVNVRKIEELLGLEKNEKLIYIVINIKAETLGFKDPTLFSKIPSYISFLEQSYFGTKENKTRNNENLKLCYAEGKVANDVVELSLSTRYSLNKMFVTETKNYVTLFDKKKFNLNYQVSEKNQIYLDYASDFLLNQNYRVRIANVNHVIIPQFLSNTTVDIEMALRDIKYKSDMLFNLKDLNSSFENIKDWIDLDAEVFWINFYAFESDGNYFKVIGLIKDISNFQVNNLVNLFYEINQQFHKSEFTNWGEIMREYGKPIDFNFNSIYKIIPVKEDKARKQKNKALNLFKAVLENRKVDKKNLYDYFVELILCHYYSRYKSYSNIKIFEQNYFYFAVRDSVFKYLAFFQLLKKLKLITMDELNPITENLNQYDKIETDFFTKMHLNQEQRAMFYLGRMLNSIEYLQLGKSKTVIQKVNFNGMDKDSIQRLRIDLIEKAKQYNAISKIIFIDQKFGKEFRFNDWNLNPQEAVFFLLTGYSFGAKKEKTSSSKYNENN